MTDFPTVGLGVDLSGIDKGEKAYDSLKRSIEGVGSAADSMERKVAASAGRRKTANQEAGKSETQRAAETERAAAKEVKAAQRAAAEQERVRRYLQRVRINSIQMEEAARRAAEMEQARDAARRHQEQVRLARDAERLARQAARAQEVAARQAGRAQEKAARDAAAVQERMARQGAAARIKAERDAAAAATKAARDREAADRRAAAEQERNARYLERVRVNSAKMEEQAQRRLQAERARAAREAERDAARLARAEAAAARAAGRGGGRGGGGGGGDFPDPHRANLLTRAVHALRDSLRETRRLFFDVRTAIGVFLGAMIVRPVIEMADAMTALRARAAAFADRSTDVPYLMEAIYETAQRARSPLDAIATLYTRLAPLAKQLGKSQLELLRISETVAKAAQVGGATAEEGRASAQQLAQALASNRLGGDELRSLAENAPILVAQIARALNMNTGQFIKWAHEGKANAEVVIGALEKAQVEVDRMFSRFPITIGQSITLVRNALSNLIGKVNEMTGASVAVATFVAQFAGFLESERTIRAVAAGVEYLGKAFKLLGQGFDILGASLPILGAIVAAMAVGRIMAIAKAWLYLRAVMLANAAAMGVVLKSTTLLAGAQAALGAAMARTMAAGAALVSFLGGPFGVALIAAAGLFAFFSKAAKDSAEALDRGKTAAADNITALDAAAVKADALGLNITALNEAVAGYATASDLAGQATDRATGKHDTAMAAAIARARAEQALTASILTRRAAELDENADKAQRGAAAKGVMRWVAAAAGRRGYSADQDPELQRLAAQAATDRSQAGQLRLLAAGLMNQPVNVTRPDVPGSKPPAAAGKDDKAKRNPFEGALDGIRKMEAAIAGLRQEIATLTANPLSALAAQIRAAGDEAAASLEAGDRQNAELAAKTRSLAMEKERLTIARQMIQESATNARQIEMETEANENLARAELKATSIMQEFWGSGSRTLEGYTDAVQRSRQAVTDAEVANSNLAIAQRYGVRTLDEIAVALNEATGMGMAYSASVQNQAVLEAAAAEAAIRRKAALDALAARDTDLQAFDADTYDEGARNLDRMTMLAENLGDSLESAFGRGGRSLGRMLSIMGSYSQKQLEVNRRVAEARALYDQGGRRSERSLQVEREAAEELALARIQGYGDMAAAAASFFKEGTTGYKVLHAAEVAFRLMEFAMSAKSIVVKAAETAAKIGFFGAQAQAAAATGAANMFATLGPLGFAAVAAMVAVLAGFGVAVSGGGGGGAPRSRMQERQSAQGAGSVLGDAEAKSESIARALEAVAANTNADLEYSNDMLRTLRSIDNHIGSLTAALSRQLNLGGFLNTEGLGLGTTRTGPSLAQKLINPIAAVLPGLFGKTVTRTLQDAGLSFNSGSLGSILGGGLTGNTYQDLATQTRKRFLGITTSNKTRYETVTGAIEPQVLDEITRIIGGLRQGVLQAAGILGVESAQALLDAMLINIGEISLKDMTGEEIEQALQAIFSKIGDEMAATAVPAILELQRAGEGAFETLARVAREYQVLDISLKSIGLSFGAVGVSSLAARQRLIDLAGGIDALVEQTDFFRENFLTEAERIAPVITAVYTELGKLGYGSIRTRDEFKALVRSLDLTTDQGAATYAMLMKLAPGFVQIVDYMDSLTVANDNVSDAQGRLNDTYNDAVDAIGETRDRFADFVDQFARFRQQLDVGPLAANSPQDQYLKTKALFDTTSALALAGDERALADLQSVSEAYLAASRDYYAGTEPYFRDLERVKAAVEGAQAYAQAQVDKADLQLAELNKLVAGQVTVNESVLTVAERVAAVQTALDGLAAAQAAQAAAVTAAVAAAQAAAQAAANANVPGATPPTTGTPNTPTLGEWTPAGYLANNPDILAAANQLLATADPNSPWFRQHGLDRGAEGFAEWHWQNQGINEPGRRYALGAGFEHGRIIDTPTAFNDDWMGEDGAETIMPLARTPSGKLGVRAAGGGDSEAVVEVVGLLVREQKISNIIAKAAAQDNSAQLKTLQGEVADLRTAVRAANG